jgi:hypothetical protein
MIKKLILTFLLLTSSIAFCGLLDAAFGAVDGAVAGAEDVTAGALYGEPYYSGYYRQYPDPYYQEARIEYGPVEEGPYVVGLD